MRSFLQSIRKGIYQSIATQISGITRYYDQLIQYQPRLSGLDTLFEQIECPKKTVLQVGEVFEPLSGRGNERCGVLLNGNFNHSFDIDGLLKEMKPSLSRTSRVFAVVYNPYLDGIFRLLNLLNVRQGGLPSTFVTMADIHSVTQLSGFEVVRVLRGGLFPWRLKGVGTVLEKCLLLTPLVCRLALVNVLILRPIIAEEKNVPSLSIVIPARNEKGNIESSLRRLPDLKAALEVIFVEGHSTDGTWEEIQRVIPLYESKRLSIKSLQQKGKGKSDAVRLGFAHASNDLLTILDADLTMPPELLGRFYDAYCLGLADFVNGSRLVYPMEGEAMRFLNRLGNVFFAKALSAVLGNTIGDSLCGTKLFARRDYERFVHWRHDFGDFDPFGDFELLFPASVLALGIIDVPIRYRARTYGETNIHRFRHGLMLLRMTGIGFLNFRLGRQEWA